jgi:hypothetical protein
MTNADEEREFRRLLVQPMASTDRAPSSLKARLYSVLVGAQQQTGPLASLQETLSRGHGICVFEKLVQVAPLGQSAKSPFFCQLCHARVLAENFENPPIYWRHCPYVQFKS